MRPGSGPILALFFAAMLGALAAPLLLAFAGTLRGGASAGWLANRQNDLSALGRQTPWSAAAVVALLLAFFQLVLRRGIAF